MKETALTRRDFLKRAAATAATSAAAGVFAGELTFGGQMATEIIDSSMEKPVQEAVKKLLDRLGFSRGKLSLDEHIVADTRPDQVLIGEVRTNDLYFSADWLENFPESGERIGGVEYLSRARAQEYYDSLRTPILVAATDGHITFSQEYLREYYRAAALREWYLGRIKTFSALATALTTAVAVVPEAKKSWTDDEPLFPRRLLLKLAGITGAGFLGAQELKKKIRRTDLADLQSLPPLEQKFVALLSQADSINLRNKRMIANINALSSVPLSDFSDELLAFAGSAHRMMANELLRDPRELATELENFLIGQGEGKELGLLYRLFALYESTKDKAQREEILGFATIAAGGFFGNVGLRVNHSSSGPEDLKQTDAKSLYNLQRAKREHPPSDSAFLIFTKAMAKLDHNLRQGTDPVIGKDRAAEAWWFFQSICQEIYRPENHLERKFDAQQNCEIGQPVAFAPGQEKLSLFNLAEVSFERGFVTRVAALAA